MIKTMNDKDQEAITRIHLLMDIEDGKLADIHRPREVYEKILERATKDEATYVKIPCAGHCCKNRVDIYCEDLRRVLDNWGGQKPSNSKLFCSHCSEHGGVGRLFTRWREACPKIFLDGPRETNPARFPEYAWGQIREWGENMLDSENSLYVFGETGSCKSRMMYLALFMYVVARELSFRVLRGGALYDLFCDNFSSRFDKKDSYENISTQLAAVDVLVFDDFGQDQLTEVMLQSLWNILDERFSEGRRTIFLSNFTPQKLKARYGKFFSMDSLVRRIEEFCTIISTKE